MRRIVLIVLVCLAATLPARAEPPRTAGGESQSWADAYHYVAATVQYTTVGTSQQSTSLELVCAAAAIGWEDSQPASIGITCTGANSGGRATASLALPGSAVATAGEGDIAMTSFTLCVTVVVHWTENTLTTAHSCW